jgi:glycosyltransferase involved in cell wall biosynthesis
VSSGTRTSQVLARPLISIVIPAHNSARFLGATLESVLAQGEARWECVVIDDGSCDETFHVARAYQRADHRVRAYRTAHGGPAAARNTGFRRIAGTSEYVTFMDSDDVWLPHALEALVQRLEGDDTVIGCHGLAEFIDGDGAPLSPGVFAARGRTRRELVGRRLLPCPIERLTSFEMVAVGGVTLFPPGVLLARRRAYDVAGPFDETLRAAEDGDMAVRLSRLGCFAFIDSVILYYRRHDGNLGAQSIVPRQAWLVRCLTFHAKENSPDQRAVLRRRWRAYQLEAASARLKASGRALARGDMRAALGAIGVPVYVWRYLRGYPLPKVTRAPLTW